MKVSKRLLLYPAIALCVTVALESAVFGIPRMPSPPVIGQGEPLREPGLLKGGGSADELSRITGITTLQENGGITIQIEAVGNIQYTAFKLFNPTRLVLDLPKTHPGTLMGSIKVDKGAVKSIRSMYFEQVKVLRLEIILNEEVPYEIGKPDENKLVIKLQPVSRKAGKQVSGEKVAEQAQLFGMETAAPVLGKFPSAKETFEEADMAPGSCDKMLRGEGEKISFDLERQDLRDFLKIVAEVGRFNLVLAQEIKGTVSMRLKNVPWNMALNKILRNNKLDWECFPNNVVRILAQIPQGQEKPQPEDEAVEMRKKVEALCYQVLFKAKKNVSLDFQQADLRHVLRFFSEIGIFNLVISPEVKGTITMQLKGVPLSEAFFLVLRNSRLSQECSNMIIRVASQDILAGEEHAHLLEELALAKAMAARLAANAKRNQGFGSELATLNTIPLELYREIQGNDPLLYANLQHYSRLFREKTDLEKMDMKNYLSLVKLYKKLIDDANKFGAGIEKTPLQTEYQALKFVGVVWGGLEPAVLVEAKDAIGNALGYTLRKGTLLGPRFGIVESIEPGQITILEREMDYLGNIIETQSIKRIQVTQETLENS